LAGIWLAANEQLVRDAAKWLLASKTPRHDDGDAAARPWRAQIVKTVKIKLLLHTAF
jgi:hypothetical protein